MLILWLHERVADFDTAITILGYGLRFDIIVLSFGFFLPSMLLLNYSTISFLNKVIVGSAKVFLLTIVLIYMFLEFSTPAFIDQYDTRPSRLYFEYFDSLYSTFTILKTSLYEYPLHFLVTFILLGIVSRYLLIINTRIFQPLKPLSIWLRLLLIPLLIFITVLGIRSSFDHCPANPSTAAFTNDQLVNKLGLNSIYNVLFAYYSLRHEASTESYYGSIKETEMMNIIRQNMMVDKKSFSGGDFSTMHYQLSTKKPSGANLVIILEESLGAGFVGKLGGIGVTPNLDKLSSEGLWFTNLYSTGTRSVRGIEAIIAGFPPSPSRSVLKLNRSQQNFNTLASILKKQNYQTQFIYGGESHFDNMAGFFLSNGFDDVIDENDYPNPEFRGSWGVSDEDLFKKLDEELVKSGDKPKFILAFTSSNHSPFEFPDNKIALHDKSKNTVNNAIKYADYALGQYIKLAKNRDYWKNTYFLIVSDHDTRATGSSLAPINKFHIPGLLIGPDIEVGKYTKIASQIDLAPTILDVLGVSAQHPMIGHSIFSLPDTYPGRAIMQYGENHAYMLGNNVVIHTPQKKAKGFQYIDNKLVEYDIESDLIDAAKAHALWPMFAYRNNKYAQSDR